MADHNKHLRFLEISRIRATNAKFKRLHSLTVARIEDADHLIAFLKANPTIDTLKILHMKDNDFSDQSFGVLINETGLRHVHVELESDKAGIWIFERVRSGHGTLRSLCVKNTYYSTICNIDFSNNLG